MSAWLKAGLIGGAILFFLDLLGQIPFLCCCIPLLMLLVYMVVGSLSAAFLPSPRDAGSAAGQGALAAVVAAFIGGIFNLIFSLIRVSFWSSATQVGQVWSELPPEMRYILRDMGLELEFVTEMSKFMAGLGGTTICGSICCLGGVIMAAILGAIGAALYAAMKSD